MSWQNCTVGVHPLDLYALDFQKLFLASNSTVRMAQGIGSENFLCGYTEIRLHPWTNITLNTSFSCAQAYSSFS